MYSYICSMEEYINPFLISAYIKPYYFCDRQIETKTLLENIKNNSNTTFFAQRRLGKTALIQHVFNQLKTKKNTECIYLDIYATQNLKDFTNQLANSIYTIFPPNKGIGKRFLEAIKLFRPVISIDSLSGAPELSLDITQAKQFEKTIPQLLQFLDAQSIKTIIAIDEFQQILNYPEKNVEAILRTAIQQLKHVNFIFCGSNQHLMHELFNNTKRPFYASTKTIHLKKIDPKLYFNFIKLHFNTNKFKITDDAINLILELSCSHTYYTQYLCHQLFIYNTKTINEQVVIFILNKIIIEQESVFFQYRNLLTPAQWQLLKAIGKEEKVEQPYSKHFINSYNFGTSAIVKRGIESLLQKEMIYYDISAKKPYYEVYDKFLMRWLQRRH